MWRKGSKRIIPLCIFAIILNLLYLVKQPASVQAAAGTKEINLGTSVLSTSGYENGQWTSSSGIKVYLGKAPQGTSSTYTPMPYRVLSSDGATSAFLDGDTVLSDFGHTTNGTAWSTSDAGQWLNTTFYNGTNYFSNIERSQIQLTNLSANSYEATVQSGTYTITDESASLYVFSMSVKDVMAYYPTTAERDKSGAHHWLRSVCTAQTKQTSTYTGGELDIYDPTNPWIRMCPTMNITLANVAFTKAYAYTDGDFAAVSDTSNKSWTLALKDGNSGFSASRTDTAPVTVRKGGTLEIAVSDSSSGYSYNQISGMLVDGATGDVLYYGKIGETSDASVQVTIPDSLEATNTYTLYVFEEQLNGQGYSSYVSNMEEINISVEELYDIYAECENNDPGYDIEGTLTQENITTMENILLKTDDEHYFPEDYATKIRFKEEGAAVWDTVGSLSDYGISVDVISTSKIEISGELTNSVSVLLPDATKKVDTALTFATYETSYVYGEPVFQVKATAAPQDEESDVVIPQDKIIYSSSNTSVAEVSSTTGQVTIKNVGSFTITAAIEDGEQYLGTGITSDTITVSPKDISADVEVSFIDGDTYEYDGQSWEPRFSVVYNDEKLIEDIDYTIVYPKDTVTPGEKTFSIQFTGCYTGTYSMKGTINEEVVEEKAPPAFVMPKTAYITKAENGKNSYYISTLTLLAPDGFHISTDSTKGFGDSVTFFESADNAVVYLRDATTDAVSDAILIPPFKIDTKSPTISGIENESIVYGSSKTLFILDTNLEEVTINGEKQELVDSAFQIELSSNYGIENYEISAVDKAGNETVLIFTLAEEWTKSGVIPVAQTVRLCVDQPYKLGAGSWSISGDSTTYCGGITFYIQTQGQYVFEQQ